MKVQVIKDFKNKYSKKVHKKGEVHDFTEKRIEEINSTIHGQLVEIVEDEEVIEEIIEEETEEEG